MGNSVDKILPGLYVGNIRGGSSREVHEKFNITHIVTVHDTAFTKHEDKKYLCIPVPDRHESNLLPFFPETNDFIHEARLSGGGVIVHCIAGVSRSVTIIIAYLMTVCELTWREGLMIVRAVRPSANPNFGFQRQLLTFYHDHLTQEKSRFWEKFIPTVHDDPAECQRLLKKYRDWVESSSESTKESEEYRTYPLGHKSYSASGGAEKSEENKGQENNEDTSDTLQTGPTCSNGNNNSEEQSCSSNACNTVHASDDTEATVHASDDTGNTVHASIEDTGVQVSVDANNSVHASPNAVQCSSVSTFKEAQSIGSVTSSPGLTNLVPEDDLDFDEFLTEDNKVVVHEHSQTDASEEYSQTTESSHSESGQNEDNQTEKAKY